MAKTVTVKGRWLLDKYGSAVPVGNPRGVQFWANDGKVVSAAEAKAVGYPPAAGARPKKPSKFPHNANGGWWVLSNGRRVRGAREANRQEGRLKAAAKKAKKPAADKGRKPAANKGKK